MTEWDRDLEQYIKDFDPNEEFPELYEVGYQNEDGWTALMFWCRHRNDPIPPILHQEVGFQTDDGLTALMIWCACKLGVPIPKFLYRERRIQNNGGFTALMFWCSYRLSEPVPIGLYDEIGLQTNEGLTALMFMSYGTLVHVPSEFETELTLRSKCGSAAVDFWVHHRPGKRLPEIFRNKFT